MELELFRVPLMVAGAATIAIGIVCLTHRATWFTALGALLLCKGGVLISAGLTSSAWQGAVGNLLTTQQILLLPTFPLAVFVLWRLQRPRADSRRAVFALLAAIAALELAFLLKPDLGYSYERGASAAGLATAGPGWVYTDYGPLVPVLALSNFALASLAVVLARKAASAEPQMRLVAFWLALGFVVNGVFDGGMAIAYLIHDPAIGGVSGLGWVLGISRSLALLPAGIALGILVGTELAKPHPQRWRWALPAVLALAAWFSGPMPVIFGAADYGQTWPTAVATGLWRAALPVLAGIGLWQLHVATKASAPAPAAAVRPRAEEA